MNAKAELSATPNRAHQMAGNFMGGVIVGSAVAGGVILGAPLAVSGLVAVGLPPTVASATVTVGVAATSVYGLSSVAGSTVGAIEGGNWSQVSFNAGALTGGFLVGGLGGGRALGTGISGQPSSLPVSFNPFADFGLNYNPNFPGGSLLGWLSTAPTPQSGAAVIGFASGSACSRGNGK
ncbi:MAG: hypothetical protein H7Y43_10605 [Akkermansiaceae bacterium]|nr:hypothetical protein [Verrucomicrobiales bacterium]